MNSTKPNPTHRIAVVIDSFNSEAFVGEAIESVLRQTRPADQIVVADASTDGSRAVIEHWASRDSRLCTTFLENRGQLATILAGLEKADGDLIFLLDGDDRYKPRHLELMEKRWAEFPHADLLYGRHELFGEQRLVSSLLKDDRHESAGWFGPIELRKPYDWGYSAALAYCLPEYHVGGVTASLSLRRAHLETLPLRKLCEQADGLLWANADYMILLASALFGGRKVYVPEQTVEYRVHGDSVTGLYASGDTATLYAQRYYCTLARSWLCARPMFGPRFFDLLETESKSAPDISAGHAELYRQARAKRPLVEGEMMNRAMRAEARVEALLSSFSWKITTPLRWVANATPGRWGRTLAGYLRMLWLHYRGAPIDTAGPRPPRRPREMTRVGFGTSVLQRALCEGQLDGIGRYTAELMAGLVNYGGIELLPYTLSGVPRAELIREPLLIGAFQEQAMVSLLTGGPFPVASRALSGKVDLLHATDHFIPKLRGIPVVATLHDAIPLSNPEWINYSFKRIKNELWKRSAHWADHILTVSEHSKKEIAKWFEIPEERISVTPLAVDERWFAEVDRDELARVRRTHDLPASYFLFVGTLQPRKNLLSLIKAHRMLPAAVRRDIPLIVAGWAGWCCEQELAELQEGDGGVMRWLRHVPEEDLLGLYKQATAVVVPSLHEGFGLPVLEAFAAGTPVVASNRGSLPEVAGDAALMVDPLNIGDMAAAMSQCIENRALADKLRAMGRERARQFSWQRTAELTIAVYEQVMRR